MAILKLINNSYDDEQALRNLCAYITNPETNHGLCAGRGIDPPRVYEDICNAQSLWQKTSGRRAYHLVLSFAAGEPFDTDDAMQLAFKMSSFFFPAFQVLYAVHDKPQQLHIHFMINPVSLQNGKKLQLSLSETAYLHKTFNDIIRDYQD